MFSLHRRTQALLRLGVAALLLATLPVAAAPSSPSEDTGDRIATARHWIGDLAGELLDAVLGALGLGGTDDGPDTSLTGITDNPTDPTTQTEPDPDDGESGPIWDPNGG